MKHNWWRGVNGGDVYVFVTGLMLMNVVFEWMRDGAVDRGPARGILRLLRGERELGLGNEVKGSTAEAETRGRKMDGSESESWERVEKDD